MTLLKTKRMVSVERLARCVLTSCALAGAVVVPAIAQQQPAEAVTYVDAAKVAEVFADKGALGKGADFTASIAIRTAAGQVEVHNKETDIFYIVAGTATFVAGGKMIDGKLSGPDQYLGVSIDGGKEYHLKQGDFITVPAGTPHWFKEVPSLVRYYIVKSVRP